MASGQILIPFVLFISYFQLMDFLIRSSDFCLLFLLGDGFFFFFV